MTALSTAFQTCSTLNPRRCEASQSMSCWASCWGRQRPVAFIPACSISQKKRPRQVKLNLWSRPAVPQKSSQTKLEKRKLRKAASCLFSRPVGGEGCVWVSKQVHRAAYARYAYGLALLEGTNLSFIWIRGAGMISTNVSRRIFPGTGGGGRGRFRWVSLMPTPTSTPTSIGGVPPPPRLVCDLDSIPDRSQRVQFKNLRQTDAISSPRRSNCKARRRNPGSRGPFCPNADRWPITHCTLPSLTSWQLGCKTPQDWVQGARRRPALVGWMCQPVRRRRSGGDWTVSGCTVHAAPLQHSK